MNPLATLSAGGGITGPSSGASVEGNRATFGNLGGPQTTTVGGSGFGSSLGVIALYGFLALVVFFLFRRFSK